MSGHGERTHARYSASGAHRWMECPGSVRQCATVPARPSGPWALDGTEAHELLEYALKNKITDANKALMASNPSWTHRTDTKQERLDSVQTALDYVYEILDAYDDAILVTEREFRIPNLIVGDDDVGGTNDIIIIVPSLDLLYVLDFKHGAGEVVEVHDNKQLQMYGIGGLDLGQELRNPDGTPVLSENPVVVLVVMQPRAIHSAGPIREWTIDGARIRAFQDRMEAAILRAEDPNAPLIPGKAQCRWCDAMTTNCPAVERQALEAAHVNFATVKLAAEAAQDGGAHLIVPDPKDFPVDKLAQLLTLAPIIEAFLSKAYDEAEAYMRQGIAVPGFKLVEAQARSKWYGADSEIASHLMALTGAGIDDVYPRKLITITDAKKLVTEVFKSRAQKGKLKQAAEDANKAVAALTLRDTSGNLKLVPVSDSRQAVPIGNAFAGRVALPSPEAEQGT